MNNTEVLQVDSYFRLGSSDWSASDWSAVGWRHLALEVLVNTSSVDLQDNLILKNVAELVTGICSTVLCPRNTGPMSLSPSSSGYQFGINSSVTSPAPGSTGLSQTVIRLILVLGTVGGTLLVILTIFLVIRAVRKHQLNYLRAGSRMDVERRVLTHRTSITDSVSSGYGSEGIVDNGRRMSRRGYASLSEFAMTSCPRPGSEWLGAYNPMFAADFHVPDSVKRIERDEIALLKKLKDVTYGKVRAADMTNQLG